MVPGSHRLDTYLAPAVRSTVASNSMISPTQRQSVLKFLVSLSLSTSISLSLSLSLSLFVQCVVCVWCVCGCASCVCSVCDVRVIESGRSSKCWSDQISNLLQDTSEPMGKNECV